MTIQPVLIAGQWRPSHSVGTFPAVNPRTKGKLPEWYPGSSWEDVAGLLRSLDHAAAIAVATEESGTATAAPTPRRSELIGLWREAAAAAFLGAYRAAWEAGEGAAEGAGAALDLFLLRQAAREVSREATGRPAWMGVALEGLAAAARRLLAEEAAPAVG